MVSIGEKITSFTLHLRQMVVVDVTFKMLTLAIARSAQLWSALIAKFSLTTFHTIVH